MTSSFGEENDFDFDASVSSINSEGERVDNLLIKRILSEMKSEFNRGAATNAEDINENENDDSSEFSMANNSDDKTDFDDKNYVEGPAEVREETGDDVLSEGLATTEVDGDSTFIPIVINKTIFDAEEEKGSEHKPRLILTLRTSEEDREMGIRSGRRSLVCQSSSDLVNSSFSDRSDTSNAEKNDIEDKGSVWESRSRRSLRSSNRNAERDSEGSGLTRSSRRFSKEHCRESVLQNAIARKEKSFSSLNQVEERSGRRGARSPRQSLNDGRGNKPFTRSKSPKAVVNLTEKSSKIESFPYLVDVHSKIDEICDSSLLNVKTETDFDLTQTKSENEEYNTDDSNDTTNMNSASTNSQTSEPPLEYKPTKVDKTYTKTGKRRTKHFKGLKYSLTTGGSVVRKKSMHASKRGRKRKDFGNAVNRNYSDVISVKTEIADEITEISNLDNNSCAEDYVADHQDTADIDVAIANVTEIKNEPSPPAGDVCHSAVHKRKYQPENEDEVAEGDKRCRLAASSPCLADTEAEPDKPEETAVTVAVGPEGLCLCNKKTALHAKSAGPGSDFYCQAVDSLDSRLIGCCNTVNKEDARLLRPSARVPFLVLCDVHQDRLQRHNCCPGCGVFCTQGKFMQCKAYHQYHKECRLMEMCPHCGGEGGCEVNISLGAHKYPVFLPLQTPNKKMPSAKMTFTYMSDNGEKEDPLPLVPADTLVLPSGLQISSHGLPSPLDKDKLDRLLHVACSVDLLSLPRYTIRNMYQAAKSGETEKIVHMLATGLNPNHVFREWGMGSALHAASNNGHLPVVHLLLQAGANTDMLDRDQNTPLMLACANGHNQVVKYLVKAGASVTFKGGDGMTALHLAAKAGNIEACHYLISNPNTPRSFIDSVDDGRWTPLVWAAEHKHHHVVKFLLEKRADPLVRDAEQNIALHWAALSGSIDISEALLNYGSDVNSTNAHADTPLHIAARQSAYECVLLLLTRGARVDMHNRAGFMPLDCVIGAPNDTYTAIKLNLELRNIALNVQKRAHKILTNDITRGHEANPVQCINSVDDEPEPQDFVYITENCFTSNISIDRTITSLQSCKCRDMCISGGCMCGKISIRCWYDDEGKLLPEFNFADPPMLFECNQACACNRLTCKNRVVQHGLIARFQLFRAKGNKGWGVRTLRLIPKGTYVCEYIGEIISDCEADTREDDSYLFDLDNRDGETYCIDARRYGNIARFINHSCIPNLLPVRVFIDHQDLHFPRIAFFANKDILANEELGFDYGEKFWIIKSKLFTCTCGTESCKYSQDTIETTLANYNKKLKQEETRS